jgi:peroxiredoxin Q/BCP
MLAEGQPAPDFTLNDQDCHPVTLSTLKGSVVVLYFYPKDATPGCTTEACDFRDSHAVLKTLGVRVLGISPDDVTSHRKFADKQELNFTLLADPERTAIRAYDVWKEKNMYGKKSMGVERTTYVIDKTGTIRKIFPKVKVDGHVGKVVETVKGLA